MEEKLETRNYSPSPERIQVKCEGKNLVGCMSQLNGGKGRA